MPIRTLGVWRDLEGFCRRHHHVVAAAVLLLAAFNMTFRLGREVVTEWDESLYATSAWEMVQSGEWLAPTFNGSIDYYNCKPPLNVWLIALSFKAFGRSLFSLRFPSAVSAWLTVLVLIVWARKPFGSLPALLAGLVLSTSFGFFYVHAGRSGNGDALFTLLILLTVVTMHRTRTNPWARAWMGPAAAGLFLLKGMAVLMPLVLILAGEVVAPRPQRRRWQSLGVACLLFLAPVLAWAGARWQVDRWLFFERMVGYDLAARTVSVIEDHPGAPWYYLDILQRYQYDWLLAGIVALFALRRRLRRAGLRELTARRAGWDLIAIWAGVTLLVPTLMQTKLPWYLNPFYPAFAVCVGWLLAAALPPAASCPSRAATPRAAMAALVLALGVAEGRLVWYSFTSRDVGRSPQGVLLAESGPITGRRVFGVNWTRADWFVAKALAGAEPVRIDDVDAFWRESHAGDYLIMRDPLDDARLRPIRSNGRSTLHRRLH